MKVCFIGGCGHGMQAYSELKELPDIQFCGVAPGCAGEDLSMFTAAQMPVYVSYEEMLDRVQPDLAVVSSVFGRNGGLNLACVRRGIDVFSEKPVAGTLEELAELEAAVRETGVRFCAMHYLRYVPAFYHARKLVKEGVIGPVRLITAQKSYKFGVRPEWYADRSLYTGTIPWVGIHGIDWIYHFTEREFRSIRALHVGNPEKAALCQFELEGGIPASLNIDFYRPQGAPTHGDDRVRVAGERGVIEVMGDRFTWIGEDGVTQHAPMEAPRLTQLFVQGKGIPAEEIFMLTRVALLARASADMGKEIVL